MTAFDGLTDSQVLALHAAQTENRRWAVDAQAGLVPVPEGAKSPPAVTWELAGVLRGVLAGELTSRGLDVPVDEFDDEEACHAASFLL